MSSDTLKKVREYVAEAFYQAKENHEDEIRSEENDIATRRQRNRDLKAAVEAFLDLKATDAQIMNLLSKYFAVDSIDEASTLITNIKITRQIKVLRDYYKEQNIMNSREFFKYAQNNKLEELLFSEQKLLYLSPEKLKKELDKRF
ncbi:MAG: hypothetical protein IKW81_10490 [Pseudobutyrivibrio sp.]|nr:hypothetical protein [Pseudobutyrivibrio sp.]